MKSYISLLLCLAVLPLFGQNNLKGKVTDSNNGQLIVGSNVYFPQLEKGVSTNDNGSFSITNLPNGKYKVIISYLGYETESLELTFPEINYIEIQLKPSVIEMEGIIVSTPFHKLQSENVMKVEQESVANLKAQGAINISDGITNIAGVESVTTGLGIGKPVIRGLSNNRVLVYTQGVRLENQQYGDEHGLGLSSNGVESVEVIKGPASLLYGSDALGGVLYLNPEKFANANTNNADASVNYFSNTQGYNTSIGAKQSGEHFKFLFRGSVAEHSDYETDAYRVTNTRFREQDIKTGFGYQITNFKTELRYNVNLSKIGIPEEIGKQSTNRTPLLPFQNITNHVLSSRSTIFFENSKLDINIGMIYNDRKEFEEHHDHEGEEHHGDEHEDEEEHHDESHEEDHGDEEAALHMKLKTLNYDVKYYLPEMGKFETIFGVQGMSQSNTNYGEEVLIPDATTNDIGVLVTSHIHFETVDIQLGARFDNRNIMIGDFNENFNSFNGALGAKTNLANKLVARVNLATGFRAPNLAELASDGSHHGTNRYEIGNLDLESEQNFQTDVALEYTNEHIEIFANGFYNIIDNYIFLSPNGEMIDGDPVFLYLQDDARLYGGEFGFHLHPHPLDWLHLESSFETVTGKQDNDDYLPLIPANSLTNTVRVEYDTNWLNRAYAFVRLRSTFNQNNVSPFETPTNSFNLLSAGFGGNISLFKNELTLYVSGTNLTNTRYINHLSRLKSDGIFNMGRNISLGITYQL